VIRLMTITLWHFDAESGRRPPHQNRADGPAQSNDTVSETEIAAHVAGSQFAATDFRNASKKTGELAFAGVNLTYAGASSHGCAATIL
jgi:hypothetical protein